MTRGGRRFRMGSSAAPAAPAVVLSVHAAAAARSPVSFHAATADPTFVARVLAAMAASTRGDRRRMPPTGMHPPGLVRPCRWRWRRAGGSCREDGSLWSLAGLLAAGALALLVPPRCLRRSRADLEPAPASFRACRRRRGRPPPRRGAGRRRRQRGPGRGGLAAGAGPAAGRGASWRRRSAPCGGGWPARWRGRGRRPDWTGGDLLGWSRRDDLRPLIRQLRKPCATAHENRPSRRFGGSLAAGRRPWHEASAVARCGGVRAGSEWPWWRWSPSWPAAAARAAAPRRAPPVAGWRRGATWRRAARA